MISSLTGRVTEKALGHAVIEVSGIGYKVLLTTSVAEGLTLDAEVQLLTRLIVREDAWTLYGFEQQTQRSIFDELLKVTGVGPKSALAIINTLDPREFVQALQDADEKAFSQAPGIGPKTSRLIIATLGGKLSNVLLGEEPELGKSQQQDQIRLALSGLGWKNQDIDKAVKQLEDEQVFTQELSLSEILRKALAGLS